MKELSLHILDLLENSIKAGASLIEVTVLEERESDRMTITIKDNGCGMSPEMVSHVLDPFVTTRTTRKVGLGLPLFAAAARHCEGDLTISSKVGEGTVVVATFKRSHIDRAPLGDIAEAITTALLKPGHYDVVYRHQVDDDNLEFDTRDIRKVLGDIPLSTLEVQSWMRESIDSAEQSLRQSERVMDNPE